MTARLYGVLTILLLVVVFAIQNAEVVTVRFLLWETAISRALLIFLVLIAGVAAGWGLHAFLRHPKRAGSPPSRPSL